MVSSTDLLLLGAGALGASVNAAAGGGTLLSFPALLATGLDPLAANATSTVGLLPGGLGSVLGLRRELREEKRDAIRVALPSLLGGIIGAATFIVAEVVAHPRAVVPRTAVPLAIGAVLGGYLGVRVVRKLPPQFLRWFASAVGLFIAAWFIVR